MRVGWTDRDWRWLVGTLVVAVAAFLIVGQLARHAAIDARRAQASIDARFRAALIDSELARFRLLPLALADDRDVIAAIDGQAAAQAALDRKLETLARVTRAAAIYVIGADGIAVATSNWRSPQSFVRNDYTFRPYFRDARTSGEGSQYALGTASGRPGLYLAHGTANRGAIVVKLEFESVEREWARAGGITIVRSPLGIVLVTSRPDWRFAGTRPLSAADAGRFRRETRVPATALSALPVAPSSTPDLFVGRGTTLVAQSAATTQPGWRLTVFEPVEAGGAVWRAGALAALMTIALAGIAWSVRQRVTLAARRTAELEAAVADRTADLRREMDERASSEARAADLREGLRQANRLAALGQITASVAHETAQPVTAIRTYALSSEALLDAGALDDVRGNLGAIGRLADRIGAITAQLRGFSRRQPGPLRPIRIVDVLDGALLIMKDQLRDVTLALPEVDPGLAVIGGKVRLEQVLVIVVQNAVEAIADGASRRIAIGLALDAAIVRLSITDSGAGVAPDLAPKLFTPFVTSRPQGLGLGLVIAQDIMAELGGWLRLMPSDGGATFEIGMRRA
ncbi:sensor histidine kinase [Sphingomonas ginsenosidivorax]|uniref:histidine kinase n=1 Tax=Sphingomonas ginsenosidivorax TaxID=862135 RepID=A0A5C6UD89_9SPHN|nr:ATP-binding protein [Sphingomonas ginsenosidivorax]TXC70614.1 sensor histidine kinase [Sphingomonas ginsenosidivorax]